MEDRLIGIFDEGRPGPLMIMLGGIHGNEQAGVKALDYLVKMLEVEPITNETFRFSGRLVAMRGNLRAMKEKKRYLRRDLNRMFRSELIRTAREKFSPDEEEKELLEIIDFLQQQVRDYHTDTVFFLDLHTTTARGGIFAIVDGSPKALEIGLELKAPVIEGFMEGIEGTLLHYINEDHLHDNCTALVFEAGQHDDPLSVNRAIAAAVNFLSAVGAVEKFHISERHFKLLRDSAGGLPAHNRLIYTHRIDPEKHFVMEPGFQNFDPVTRGQRLAREDGKPVVAPAEGMILMPLYQEQGEDGFFIIEPVSDRLIAKTPHKTVSE